METMLLKDEQFWQRLRTHWLSRQTQWMEQQIALQNWRRSNVYLYQ
jgi:hypothetical protein